jgi:hypothetical protein
MAEAARERNGPLGRAGRLDGYERFSELRKRLTVTAAAVEAATTAAVEATATTAVEAASA